MGISNAEKIIKGNKDGQVMVIAVMAMGGALLGISALAGLLMTYQIRQTTDLANSTKAIMAADSGLEWGLYQYFHPSNPINYTNPTLDPNSGESLGPYSNGATVIVNCYGLTIDYSKNPPQPTEPLLTNCSNASSVQTIGESNFANRSFRAYFRLFGQ